MSHVVQNWQVRVLKPILHFAIHTPGFQPFTPALEPSGIHIRQTGNIKVQDLPKAMVPAAKAFPALDIYSQLGPRVSFKSPWSGLVSFTASLGLKTILRLKTSVIQIKFERIIGRIPPVYPRAPQNQSGRSKVTAKSGYSFVDYHKGKHDPICVKLDSASRDSNRQCFPLFSTRTSSSAELSGTPQAYVLEINEG
jgi:hypothetical protein